MNDCPNGDIRDLLPDLLHDRLDASERERVESHVATCEPCAAELGLLRDLRATMRRVPAIDTSAIAASIPAYRVPVRRRWTAWRAAAAIAAIAVGGTSIAVANRQSGVPIVVEKPSNDVPNGARPAPNPAEGAAPGSSPIARSPQVAAATPPGRPDVTTPGATAMVDQELAMAGGTVTDLSDGELDALLDELETFDAVPSTDVEGALPVTPLEPAGETR